MNPSERAELEAELRRRVAAQDLAGAMTAALRGYGHERAEGIVE